MRAESSVNNRMHLLLKQKPLDSIFALAIRNKICYNRTSIPKSFHSIVGLKPQIDMHFHNHPSALNVEPSLMVDVDIVPEARGIIVIRDNPVLDDF